VVTLETERLSLEPWNERHRTAWRLICRDPEVMRFIALGTIWETDKADEVFDRTLAHWHKHGFGWRPVLDKANGNWLGFVGLNHIGPGIEGVVSNDVEIGWWIISAAWGRGYATEGAVAIRDEGFERVGLERLIARLQPANTASARVAEKIGMRFELETTGHSGEVLSIYLLDRLAKPDQAGRRSGG
jgi:RimJ/RimL family protein N-acetyltransferase